MSKYFVIPDIHGEFDKLTALWSVLETNGLSLENGDIVVQLGDMVDRGPDSYKVVEFFKNLQLMWTGQVIVLEGNHEAFFIDACKGDYYTAYMNGCQATEKSYSQVTKIYGKNGLGNSVNKVGHFDWLNKLPLYHETPDYFFSHAPIPKEFWNTSGRDFRMDEHVLTWSYVDGVPETEWVDGMLIPKDSGTDFKITVHGHIHSGFYNKTSKEYHTPNPRKINNAILLDSGCGCWQGATLSAIELPSLKVYNNLGEVTKL